MYPSLISVSGRAVTRNCVRLAILLLLLVILFIMSGIFAGRTLAAESNINSPGQPRQAAISYSDAVTGTASISLTWPITPSFYVVREVSATLRITYTGRVTYATNSEGHAIRIFMVEDMFGTQVASGTFSNEIWNHASRHAHLKDVPQWIVDNLHLFNTIFPRTVAGGAVNVKQGGFGSSDAEGYPFRFKPNDEDAMETANAWLVITTLKIKDHGENASWESVYDYYNPAAN